MILRNRVYETSTTTGTGNITLLGAYAAGFNTFYEAGVLEAGDTFPYVITDSLSQPTFYEAGTGTLLTTTTFSRDPEDSTNNNALVDLPTGTHIVFLSPLASWLSSIATIENVTDAIDTALVPYAKTVDVTAAIDSALAPYYTASETDSAINTALDPYSTTAEVETLLGAYLTTAEAATTYITPAAVDTKIDTALTDYTTTNGLETLLESYLTETDAAATYSTPASVDTQIDTALTPYLTEADAAATYITPSGVDGKIAAATINTSQLSGDLDYARIVGTGPFADKFIPAIGTPKIAALAVTDAKVNDVAAGKITGTLTSAQLPSTLTGKTLTGATLTTPTIGDFTNATHDHTTGAGGGTLTGAALGTQAANKLLSGPPNGANANPTFRTMVGADIPDALVNTNHIATNAVTQTQMADNSVGTNELINSNVTLAKLADGTPFLFMGYDSAGEAVARDGTIDTLGNTGESWTVRQLLYLDEASNTWFKINNTYLSLKIGLRRGVALTTETHPATNVRIREYGLLDGFSSLTPGDPIYSTTTAGGYTQTTPAPVYNDFAEIVVNEMGYAASATQMFVDPQPIQYTRYLAMLDGDEITITHHADASPRKRVVMAQVVDSDSSLITSYASSNQDASLALQGAGATVVIDSTGASTQRIGDTGGADGRVAQSFQVTAGGRLTSITVRAGATTGTPSQFPIWSIQTNSGSIPSGTAIASDTMSSWTASADNTITIGTGIYLQPGTTYWLVLELPLQANNNLYNILYNAAGGYASGVFKYDTTTGGAFPGTWLGGGGANDMRMSFTTTPVSGIGMATDITSGLYLASARLWLKRTGTLSGTLTLEASGVSIGSGAPSGTIATSDPVLASSVGTSYGWVEFLFPIAFTPTGSTTGLYLRTTDSASNSNYIEWGVDISSPTYGYQATSLITSTWRYAQPATAACFELYGVDDFYETTVAPGRWAGTGSDLVVRYDDGAGANQDTNTTYKNSSGQSMPVILRVQF